MTDQQPATETKSDEVNAKSNNDSSVVVLSPLVFGVILVIVVIAAAIFAPKKNAGNGNQPGPGQNPTFQTQESKPYHEFLERGANLIRERRFRDAEQEYLKAHKLAPNAAETNAELGVFYSQLKQFQKAEPFLATARQEAASRADIAGFYALCLAALQKPKEAKKEIAEALKLDPNYSRNYLAAARIHGQFRDWQKTEMYLQLLLKREPKNQQALQLLAQCFGEQYKLEPAYQAYLQLLQEFPGNQGCYNDVLKVALLLNKEKDILNLFKDIYGKFPSEELAITRAHALALFPETFEEALTFLDSAIAEMGEKNSLKIEKASLLYLDGQYKNANEILKPIIQSGNDLDRALVVAALIARAEKQEQVAEEHYVRLANTRVGLAQLGTLSLMRENLRFEQALQRVSDLAKASPAQRNELQAMRGEILAESGQFDKAIETLSNALKNGVVSPDLQFNLGMSYLAKGQFDLAIKQFNAGLCLTEDNINAQQRRPKHVYWLAVSKLLKVINDQAARNEIIGSVVEPIGQNTVRHFPQRAYSELAKVVAGQSDQAQLLKSTRGYDRGPFFDNDRYFSLGLAAELQNQTAQARDYYQKAIDASYGHEHPYHVAKLRLSQIKKP